MLFNAPKKRSREESTDLNDRPLKTAKIENSNHSVDPNPLALIDIMLEVLLHTDLSPKNIMSMRRVNAQWKANIDTCMPILLEHYTQQTKEYFSDLSQSCQQSCIHLITDTEDLHQDNAYQSYRTLLLSFEEQQREFQLLLKNEFICDDIKQDITNAVAKPFTIENMVKNNLLIDKANNSLIPHDAYQDEALRIGTQLLPIMIRHAEETKSDYRRLNDLLTATPSTNNTNDIINIIEKYRHLNGFDYRFSINLSQRGFTRVPSNLVRFASKNLYLSIDLQQNNINNLCGFVPSAHHCHINLNKNEFSKMPKEILLQANQDAQTNFTHLYDNNPLYYQQSLIGTHDSLQRFLPPANSNDINTNIAHLNDFFEKHWSIIKPLYNQNKADYGKLISDLSGPVGLLSATTVFGLSSLTTLELPQLEILNQLINNGLILTLNCIASLITGIQGISPGTINTKIEDTVNKLILIFNQAQQGPLKRFIENSPNALSTPQEQALYLQGYESGKHLSSRVMNGLNPSNSYSPQYAKGFDDAKNHRRPLVEEKKESPAMRFCVII